MPHLCCYKKWLNNSVSFKSALQKKHAIAVSFIFKEFALFLLAKISAFQIAISWHLFGKEKLKVQTFN
jgi:hypothetical protein